jgi:hypothetical protein
MKVSLVHHYRSFPAIQQPLIQGVNALAKPSITFFPFLGYSIQISDQFDVGFGKREHHFIQAIGPID